ncbi:23S rRNA (pseudouridine(1915)-N(3))-methyltransferase RlmH [Bombilactobacillus thymidiniphilus]|uniref:Ribosomal RNA large subunit methyltransferase H n=1 Tax=Bombilactobacillus thymidiniphilus TaxID=2923363 RepID=A0ABY4PFG9_9LACO|nr:23S rRNA (pseudouridine(1915)-N(3))-methyltransferase RlmH [Bombilactobacillus thymidiniphilus]UQS84286.1 23S rRNA (pseudouridine(1915)-N(3))-methyltransferase RlmH [Bombilactobacillus thymidiniphilus]
MKIKIIGVGKIKKKYFTQGIAEYSKRLQPFCDFEIVEVKDEKAPENLSAAQMQQVKDIEGQRILTKIKSDDYVIVLAIDGQVLSSEELAQQVADLTTYGHSKITFVIGGSLGLGTKVMQRAQASISFGRFTLPHQLMRLVLTEQVYRICMINAGNHYHK